MGKAPITKERIDELLRFLPVLGNPGPDTQPQWQESHQETDGVYTMPHLIYPAAVNDFFSLAAQECWCDFQYTTANAGEMVRDDDAIASATLAQIKTMLTFCVRGERFCEGHWGAMVQEGRIGAILRRLSQLRSEAPDTEPENAVDGDSKVVSEEHGRQPSLDVRRRSRNKAAEYTRDELVQALRSDGPRLLAAFFKPERDLNELIRASVAGNTFRGFRNMAKPPSKLFRDWARSRLSSSAMQEFGQLQDQAAYDAFVDCRAEDLASYWQAEGEQPLRFGPGRKLINLLFKRAARSTIVLEANRDRLIHLLHVPLDEYSLTAVRKCAASDEFGAPIIIPANAKMGWISSQEQYARLQQVMRQIAALADMPPICFDLLAWDYAHSG